MNEINLKELHNLRWGVMDDGTRGTHYSLAFSPQGLRSFAEAAAVQIRKLGPVNRTVLIYRGMSGISLATAIAMQFQDEECLGQIYVRKENEISHGYCQESYGGGPDTQFLVFVDDFIATGQTLFKCLEAVAHYNSFQNSLKVAITQSYRYFGPGTEGIEKLQATLAAWYSWK